MKIWTEAERAAIQQRYPVESTAELAAELGVTSRQLRLKAFTMGMHKLEARETGKYRNHKARDWTEREDALIREWWPVISCREQCGKNSAWLAQRLGVSVGQIRTRASALGLRKLRQKEPPWSDEELELLDAWLHLHPKQIRYRLKRQGYLRTEASITVQRFRRFGGLGNATGGYSANQLAQFMGISVVPVIGWIKKGWLKATPRGDSVADHGGPGDRWTITPKAVRTFLFDNAALINSRGIDFVWLIDLLRGD